MAVIAHIIINRISLKLGESIHDQFNQIEKIFGIMMIFSASAMAFAHGSNDVANGIGPMAAIVSIVESGGEMAQKSSLPLWILLIGGFGIVLGLSTLGYRVMPVSYTHLTLPTIYSV